jgi:hypothetical protein
MPAPSPEPSRTSFVLAAVGAGLASLYWGGMTLLIGAAASGGQTSPTAVILPMFLIGLYALRAYQIFQGNGSALSSALWLHGIGGVMALVQMPSGGPVIMVLQGIKAAIHVFGGVTAYLARKAWLAQQ